MTPSSRAVVVVAAAVAVGAAVVGSRWDAVAAYRVKRAEYLQANELEGAPYTTLNLTAVEEEANRLFADERDRFVQQQLESSSLPVKRFFYSWDLPSLQQEPLYQVLRAMPKGGVSHIHSGSSGDVHWLLDDALSLDNAFVYLGPDNASVCLASVGAYQVDCKADDDVSKVPLTHGQVAYYDPTGALGGHTPVDGFVTVASARAADPDGFNETMLSLYTVGQELEALDDREAWARFQPVFARLATFLSYRPAYLGYLENTFQVLADDGVQHVELRAIFGAGDHGGLYDLSGGAYTGTAVIQCYQDALAAFQQTHPGFTARLICSTSRTESRRAVQQDLEAAFEAKATFPHLVSGFDLVAEEDTGNPTLYYERVLSMLPVLEHKYGVELDLYLHDGESDFRGNTNVFDAVLLGVKRIGHGFNLFWFPLVRQDVKRLGIAVEVCPLSNQILRYNHNLQHHAAGGFIAEGLPVVLSSDDPGVFGYTGMTLDYWTATTAWTLDLRALKVLVFNTIDYAAMGSSAKAVARAQLEARWRTFVVEAIRMLKGASGPPQ